VVSARGRSRFDSVVVSTGTTFVPVAFPGSRKAGVHVLATEANYVELSEACPGYSRLLLVGSGLAALAVVDGLVRKGIQVVMAAGGPRLRLCSNLHDFVLEAAGELGVTVRGSPMRKAIGLERVEAALVGGDVLPCDGIVVVPRRAPILPVVPAEVSPSGEMLVDSMLKSTVTRLFAAGGCAAQRRDRASFAFTPAATARASGLVAGSNAAGSRSTFAPVWVSFYRVLGLSIASAGLALADARAAGYEAMESCGNLDGSSACSIVFEVGTRRVLGIQYVGRRTAPTPELFALVVSKGILLGDLAFLEHTGSNDISSILEAASEGMRLWQRS